MTPPDTLACSFVQVVAGSAGGSWVEIVRAGRLPPALVAATRTTKGGLDVLLGWMRADDLPAVRSAMQAVRLGAPCRTLRIAVPDPTAGLRTGTLEVSGGEWRAGLWAYVLRVEPEPPAASAPMPGADVGQGGEAGVVEYEHPSVNVRLDAVALRLHGLPGAAERDIPVIEWAACFDGEDQIGAISGLCWPAAAELPRRLSLRLAGGAGVRIELVVSLASRRGAVRALCRAVPGVRAAASDAGPSHPDGPARR